MMIFFTRTRRRTLLQDRRGVAALEFGLVVPVLVLLLLAIANLGIAAIQKMRLTNAARAGVEYALSYPWDVSNINTRVSAALNNWSGATVQTTCQCDGGTSSPDVCTQVCSGVRVMTISANRPFTPIPRREVLPFPVPTMLVGSVTLRAQ